MILMVHLAGRANSEDASAVSLRAAYQFRQISEY